MSAELEAQFRAVFGRIGGFRVTESPNRECEQIAHNRRFVTSTDQRANESVSFDDMTIPARLFRYLAPWDTRARYPGKHALWRRFSPGYRANSVYAWIIGKRPAPLAMFRHWREILASQAARIAELDSALADEIARLENRPKRVAPFEAIRRKRLERPREP